MQRRLTASAVLLLLLLGPLPAGLSVAAIAQNQPQTTVPTDMVKELSAEKVGEDASKLLSGINEAAEAGQGYLEAMKDASEEDRQVLQLQLFTLQQRVVDNIHRLVDVLLELEKTGAQPELRRQVEAVFALVTPRLWFHIDRLRTEIDAARAQRTEASAEQRPAVEYKITKLTAQLDRIFEMSLVHIEKMAQLGLDAQTEKTKLAELLAERADELSGRIALASERIADLEALRKEIPDDTDVPKRLVAAVKSLSTSAASQEITLGLMEKLEMDTSAYRTQLVETTRDISAGLTDTGVAVRIAGHAVQKTTGWLVESGPRVLLKLLLFTAILTLFYFAKRVVGAGMERALSGSKVNLSQLARHMVVRTTANLVMIFGVLVALSQLGISLGPLLAGLGVAGFIIGFALQDSLSNFASGIMILLYRPYDVGDLIDVGGVYGKVNKMSLVSTTISTLDNQLIVVPNNKIWGDVIKNVTAQDIRRVDMVFGIAYSDDIDKAEAVLNDILTSHEKVLDEPAPMVRLHTLGESSVDFIARPWVKAGDYWDVYWDVTKSVKLRFDREGISIPFPQRDVHVYNQDAAAAGAS